MSLEDDRVRFYLRNREQIEEWAALRGEAAQAVDEWLLDLRTAIEALAPTLARAVDVQIVDEGSAFPGFRLIRPPWTHASNGDSLASISLEWPRGRTTLGKSASPYVGLRCAKDRSLGAALRESPLVRQARARRGDATSMWWVAYGYVMPKAPFPEDADAYRAQLVEALRAAWVDYAPAIDAVTLPDEHEPEDVA